MPILHDELSVSIKDLWGLRLAPAVRDRWDELKQHLEHESASPPNQGEEDQTHVSS